MAIETDADRLSLFDDFDDAIFTPSGGSASAITGVFDREYLGVDSGRVDVDARTPTFLCRDTDIPSAAQDDTLEVDSVVYTIVGVEPDGTGMTTLILAL